MTNNTNVSIIHHVRSCSILQEVIHLNILLLSQGQHIAKPLPMVVELLFQ